MKLLNKIIHEATKSFTDEGPFGAGPVFSMANPRNLARAIHDLNVRTWTPTKILRSETARQMGERFPILAVSQKTDKSFGEWLEAGVKRINESRNMEQAIIHVFGFSEFSNFDGQRFLTHLESPALAEVSAHPGRVIGAVQYIACSDASGVVLSSSDWSEILNTGAYLNLQNLDRDAFMKRITMLRNDMSFNAAPEDNDLM